MIPIKKFSISMVVFDFDGTLTTPGALDFSAIRKALRCPLDQPVLEFLERIKKPHKRRRAYSILDQFEIEAAKKTKPNEGTEPLIHFLDQAHIPRAIITRNRLEAVRQSFKNFKQLKMDDFECIITRDDPIPPKPNGEGLRYIAEKRDIPTSEILMVGDYKFDIQAGRDAGTITMLLNSREKALEWKIEPDFIVQSLEELFFIIRPQ